MFRIYCMENWFNLSDRPMEDTLYEIVGLLLPCSEGPLSGHQDISLVHGTRDLDLFVPSFF